MYSSIYHYKVDGKEYTCSSNFLSSVRTCESNSLVYYDSNDPSRCMTKYSKLSNALLLVFLILPLIFIAVGVINIKKINKRV